MNHIQCYSLDELILVVAGLVAQNLTFMADAQSLVVVVCKGY